MILVTASKQHVEGNKTWSGLTFYHPLLGELIHSSRPVLTPSKSDAPRIQFFLITPFFLMFCLVYTTTLGFELSVHECIGDTFESYPSQSRVSQGLFQVLWDEVNRQDVQGFSIFFFSPCIFLLFYFKVKWSRKRQFVFLISNVQNQTNAEKTFCLCDQIIYLTFIIYNQTWMIYSQLARVQI